MYSHGLATICMCEAYGLSHDPVIGKAAQAAVNFIQAAQHKTNGGWRYKPQFPDSDTSVVGWQVHGPEERQMAYLQVDPQVLGRRQALAGLAWPRAITRGCSPTSPAPAPSRRWSP